MQEIKRPEYEAPKVETLTDEQILEELGSAQASVCPYQTDCRLIG